MAERHDSTPAPSPDRLPACFDQQAVLLVGNLKVGKSALASLLSGHREHPVHLPGSDVELSWGPLSGDRFCRVVDAPGIYSLLDRSEEARVIRRLLLDRSVGAVLLVLDAKNLRRGLPLALQLAELELPVVVALNMTDEARQRGVTVDAPALARLLGLPVVPTVAPEGQGLGQLRRQLAEAAAPRLRHEIPTSLQPAHQLLLDELQGSAAPLPANGLAYLLLADAPGADEQLAGALDSAQLERIQQATQQAEADAPQPDIALAEAGQVQAEQLARQVTTVTEQPRPRWMDRLGVWAREPATGVPIAILVLALVYFFVGWVGATWLVDLLEARLFGQLLLPWIDAQVAHIPWAPLRELLTGDFGLLSVGLVLSVGIVTPVLATFFFAFAVLEDSGYLPRLSLLMDRVLRRIGLNGKGVLPLLMGFSCITMAVLTTRMLDSRKQRIIATLLLVLVFPCAPLLSVMLVLLGRVSFWATPLVFGVLLLQLGLVGYLSAKLLPGRNSDFILELPPLRAPRLRNVMFKAGHRLLWFLREAIPYFIAGTLALFLLDQLGLLEGLRDLLRPVLVHVLGLPRDSADVFLLTVMRREAGAALLAKQYAAGGYNGLQVVVALLVMTLLVPCINTVLIMIKERGVLVGSAMLAFTIAYALVIGAAVHAACSALGVQF